VRIEPLDGETQCSPATVPPIPRARSEWHRGPHGISLSKHRLSVALSVSAAVGAAFGGAPAAAIAWGTNVAASRAVVRADSEEHPRTTPYALRDVHCRRMGIGAFACTFPAHAGKLGGDVVVTYHRGAYTVGEPNYETTGESPAASFTPAFYVAAGGAVIGAVIGLITIILALIQLKRILHTVRLGRDANSLQAAIYCSNRYNELIKEIPSPTLGDTHTWEYRFWDLITIEFFFFRREFLDRDIFELWMVELVAGYATWPGSMPGDKRDSHRAYLDSRPWQLGPTAYTEMYKFFQQLMNISEEPAEPRLRAKAIKDLIDDPAHA
jgi:hypothetical protein